MDWEATVVEMTETKVGMVFLDWHYHNFDIAFPLSAAQSTAAD